MFPSNHAPSVPSYQPYGTSEQLQQQFEQNRQASDYAHRQQLEEMGRRHAAQMEQYRRDAELQRRRHEETMRRFEMEREASMKKMRESIQALGIQLPSGLESRRPKFDSEAQNLFSTLYGYPQPQSQPPVVTGQHPTPAASRVASERSSSIKPRTKVRFATEDSAALNTKKPTADGPVPKATPIVASPALDGAPHPETRRIDTSPSHKAVIDILSKFTNLKSSFTFPATLDFLPPPEGISTPAPKLAYTPNNAPLHQYEHLLTGLLTQLDAVESYGDAKVRKARKDAVKEIEKELEGLDGQKVNERKRQFEPRAIAIESVSEPTPDADTVQSVTLTKEDTPRPPSPVDPASIPLPQDDDRELCIYSSPEPDHDSSIEKSTLESGGTGHRATEDDCVHITPVDKLGDLDPATRELEGSGGKIEDDWELDFVNTPVPRSA
ncbi:hypothetical protein FRC09_008172 [Ceratobasidium sp. 395]|nr:hypothetical protein FRC09_008172 [Ceratobasidium sp. 395]